MCAPAPIASRSASRASRRFPAESPTRGAICAHAIRTFIPTPVYRDPSDPSRSPTMVVPELPSDIADLKERVGRFVADEVFPLEEKIAATGAIDFAAVDQVRKKARAAGFSMLNMPEEAGGAALSMLGQVALEEESGKATNGLGFAVVHRGPAELWEILTPEQRDRWVVPILRGEYREAWAVTEPGAGSDVSAVAATAVRDGDEWV